jgi:hypothetical protein
MRTRCENQASRLERNHAARVGAAYTGTYCVEGDKWITKVEVAWNPEWVGSEQTFFQAGPQSTKGVVTVAGDAELARQRGDAQHSHL